MSAQAKSSKEDKQRAVSKAILEVIEKDGLTGITHSKVSRKSGVSRAWIYEYVGKQKNDLIEFGAEAFASDFVRAKLELPKNREQLEKQLKEGIDFVFNTVALDPVIIKLYFRFRGTDNPVGNVIGKYEKQWFEGAQKTITEILGIPSEQASILAELVMTLRLGFAHRFATANKPKETRERAEQIFDFIHGTICLYLSSTEE